MGEEYIRRGDAITAACKGFCHPGVRCPDEPCREQTKYLRELPSADVIPVRHARWVNGCCDRCGEHALYWQISSTYHESDFCPFCGAKMDEEGEE